MRLTDEHEAKNGFVDEVLCLLPDTAEGLQRYEDFSELITADLAGMNSALNELMKHWRSLKSHVELQKIDARQDKAEFNRRMDSIESEAKTLELFGYGYFKPPIIRLTSVECDLPKEPA